MTGRQADEPGSGPDDGLRRRIAAEAARGMAHGSDARRAVFRAARRLTRGWVPPDRLPDAAEVRAAAEALPGGPRIAGCGDRFDRIAALVGLLATVRRNSPAHQEADALEHALSVFASVHAERPYDEELLTAALVREVGLALDRDDPVAAGLEALGDLVTDRTRWLVESAPVARAYIDRSLGHRARQRLEAHADFEAVVLVAEAARRGGMPGAATPTLDEAIAILRALDGDDSVGADGP